MPIEVTVPSAGGGGGGANTDGSNITSPSTWRTNLGVASINETRRLGFASGHPGVCLDGINGTRILGPILAAPGTGDFSMWVRFGVPVSNPAVSVNLIAITLAAGYSNASGSAHVFIDSSGSLAFAAGDGTNSVSGSLAGFVSANAGQIADAVLTRSGTAWTLYLNGVSVATGTSTPGSVNVSNNNLMVGGNYDTGTVTFQGIVQRAVYFNRTLTDAEESALVTDGIHPTDQWASTSNIYSSNYASTVDGWASAFVGNCTLTANSTDPGSTTQTLRVERTGAGSGRADISQASAFLVPYRRYRATAYLYNGNISGSGFFTFGSNGLGPIAGTNSSSIASGASGTVTGQFVSAAANDFRIGPATTLDGPMNANVPNGSFYHVKNLTIAPVGALVDLNFTIGIGSYFPDRSHNVCPGDGAGGINHIEPIGNGVMCIAFRFNHADISATGGTTKLFVLPPNCAYMRTEMDRQVAFDAATTLSVGTSGNPTQFMSNVTVAATGLITSSAASVSGLSATANTQVFIRKNQATTVGTVVVRVLYEIRD